VQARGQRLGFGRDLAHFQKRQVGVSDSVEHSQKLVGLAGVRQPNIDQLDLARHAQR
jgi:hypothetical protein